MSQRTLKLAAPPMHGDDVKQWQQELNDQYDGMHVNYRVTADGEYGARTRAATATLLYALGIAQDEIDRGVTPELRIKVRNRKLTPTERARFVARVGWRRRLRNKHAAPTASGPQKALAEAAKHVGKNEARDMAWVQSIITDCIGVKFRVAWCGCFVHHCLRAAEVTVTSRCASVNATLQDALAGRNGFRSCVYRRSTGHGSIAAIRPGDVLGLFGESTHMCLAKKRVPGGWLTNEGNTSADNQSNGRACEDKFRPDTAIVYAARPAYLGG